MSRLHVFYAVLVVLIATCAPGQQVSQVQGGGEAGRSVSGTTDAAAPAVAMGVAGGANKQQITHQLALYENAARDEEDAHPGSAELGRVYTMIGLLDEDLALLNQAEANIEHAVVILRQAPNANRDLATTLSAMGGLHITMGKLREAEKEENEALQIRQSLGDTLQIARSWKDLGALYLAQHKYAKARDVAQKAVDELTGNVKANAFDRIWARYVLGMALCSTKECPSAVTLLRDAVKEAEATFPAKDLPVGLGEYLLGYACWKAGAMSEAGERMQQGIANMNAQLGWGHPTYLGALTHYAEFLRADHQKEAADNVERRIRQAEAVVDVHALQGSQGAIGFAGLR